MIVKISNCDLDHPDSGVRIWGGTSLTITDSTMSAMEVHDMASFTMTNSSTNTSNIGILLDDVGWADVTANNLGARWPLVLDDTPGNVINNVTGTDSDGYSFKNSNTVVNFFHNTLYGGESAVKQNGVAANYGATVYAYNNIVTGTQQGFKLMNNSVLYADNNLFWGVRREFFAWPIGAGTFYIGDNNLIDFDPEFVDRANGDYHLTYTSPAIDAGDVDTGVTVDMDGDLRPMGAGYDIGADEAM
jgi:hypothetical protein